MRKAFLPTPAKFHYVFNMRELSRVFQGVFRPGPDVVSDEGALVMLWRHEALRVFSDKLTSHADKKKLRKQLDELCGSVLQLKKGVQVRERAWRWPVVPSALRRAWPPHTHTPAPHASISPATHAPNPQDARTRERSGEPLFVDFARPHRIDSDGMLLEERRLVYEPVASLDVVRKVVTDLLREFNEAHPAKALPLVLFDDALHHLMRLCRVLCMPRGNALLVGVGGSGKQSLTKLAAHICKQQLAQLTVNKAYGVQNLLDDLQRLYVIAGKEVSCVWCVTEGAIALVVVHVQ